MALGEIVIDFYGHLLAADCIGHGLHAFNDCLAQLSAAIVPSLLASLLDVALRIYWCQKERETKTTKRTLIESDNTTNQYNLL